MIGIIRFCGMFFDFHIDVLGAAVIIEKAIELGRNKSTDQFFFTETRKGFKHRGKVIAISLLLTSAETIRSTIAKSCFSQTARPLGIFLYSNRKPTLGFEHIDPPDFPGVYQYDRYAGFARPGCPAVTDGCNGPVHRGDCN